MSSKMLSVCSVFTVIFAISFAQDQGQPCRVNNGPGVCKLINLCPAAIAALQIRRIPPQICGFLDITPIVCCPEETPAIITTTTPAPPATTTPAVIPRHSTRKAYQKCAEYSRYVNETIYPPTMVFSDPVVVNRCGHKASELILGGENAKPREFPHMVALGFEDGSQIRWSCGGTLISERFVLTAGHCTFVAEFGDVKRARVGDLNLESTDDEVEFQEYDVAQIIRHPDYKPPSRYNDIALLQLDQSVLLDSFTVPACLNIDADITEHRAIATGWGKTENGSNSAILQKVTLDMFTQEDCNISYAPLISQRRLRYGIIPDLQLCAGSHTEVKDTCQGDSGGPLQVYQDDSIYCMYRIIGITSFGSGCGGVGIPGVYTRVSTYINWIESIVWP